MDGEFNILEESSYYYDRKAYQIYESTYTHITIIKFKCPFCSKFSISLNSQNYKEIIEQHLKVKEIFYYAPLHCYHCNYTKHAPLRLSNLKFIHSICRFLSKFNFLNRILAFYKGLIIIDN